MEGCWGAFNPNLVEASTKDASSKVALNALVAQVKRYSFYGMVG